MSTSPKSGSPKAVPAEQKPAPTTPKTEAESPKDVVESTVASPKAAKVESPKAAKIESPKAAKIESPKAAKIESPKAAKIESPKAAKVESPKAAKAESPKKRAAEEGETGEEPLSKKQKTESGEAAAPLDEVKTAALKKQIEYYFSDKNLEYDAFFHEIISKDKDGYIPLSTIMNCNNIRKMHVTESQICAAIAGSTDVEANAEKTALRRKDNKELPKLQERSSKGKGKGKNAQGKGGRERGNDGHAEFTSSSDYDREILRGGCLLRVKALPEHIQWTDCKNAMRAIVQAESFPAKKTVIHHATTKKEEKSGNGMFSPDKQEGETIESIYLCISAFDKDMAYFKENVKTLKVKSQSEEDKPEVELAVELITNPDEMQALINSLPQQVQEARKRHVKNMVRNNSKKQLKIGSFSFPSIALLKQRVKTITMDRENGELLKVGSNDYNLILELLKYHPRGEEKSKGLTGLKVDQSLQGDSRCFFIIRGDGEQPEDFSMNKILDAITKNPPFV